MTDVPDFDTTLARWDHILRDDFPSDRRRAERAIVALWAGEDLPPPLIVWGRSPREGAVLERLLDARHVLDGRPDSWRAAIDDVLGARPSRVSVADWQAIVDAAARQVEGSPTVHRGELPQPDVIGDSPEGPGLKDHLMTARERVMPLVASSSMTLRTAYRLHDLPAPEMGSTYLLTEFYVQLIGYDHMHASGHRIPRAWRLLAEIMEASAGWFAQPGVAILMDRPVASAADDEGRAHSDSGPAAVFGDGWQVYAHHGRAVPAAAIDDPASLTIHDVQHRFDDVDGEFLRRRYGWDRYLVDLVSEPKAIATEPDTALARAALELAGLEAFMTAAGSVIDHDLDRHGEPRRLWMARRRHDPVVVALEVIDTTPKADGSRTHHWLRVPPGLSHCRDAVAWTFGLEAAAYAPMIET